MRELLKAAVKTGTGFIGTLLFSVVMVKIIAVITGPNGVGLFSLLRQIQQTGSVVGTMGGQTALVQGLASREGQARDAYLVTVFWFFVLGSILIAAVLVSLAPWIAFWVFGKNDPQTTSLVRWIAVPVVLGVALAFLNGLLNGFRAIGRLAWVQVQGAIITALLAYPVSMSVKAGYAIAFVWMLSAGLMCSVMLSLFTAYRAGWLRPLFRGLRFEFHSTDSKHFLSIAGTTLITSLIGTGTLLALRALIVQQVGLAGAGIFDVAWTLSMTYVLLVLTSFSTYYLPTLSGTAEQSARIALMQRIMRFSTLLMVPLVTTVIVLKPLLIEVLYSHEFTPSLQIARWMLLGDYFKVPGWVLAMPMVAYADMKVFFWTELLWNFGFLVLSAIAIFSFDNMQGIGIAFLFLYITYLAYTLYYAYSRHQLPVTKKMMLPWLIGLALIVAASYYTWAATQVDWLAAPIWIVTAVASSWLVLDQKERRQVRQMFLKVNKV